MSKKQKEMQELIDIYDIVLDAVFANGVPTEKRKSLMGAVHKLQAIFINNGFITDADLSFNKHIDNLFKIQEEKCLHSS